jgi:hypothetical protein
LKPSIVALAPPVAVIVLEAVVLVAVILENVGVRRVGGVPDVVNVWSEVVAIPAELTAKA